MSRWSFVRVKKEMNHFFYRLGRITLSDVGIRYDYMIEQIISKSFCSIKFWPKKYLGHFYISLILLLIHYILVKNVLEHFIT